MLKRCIGFVIDATSIGQQYEGFVTGRCSAQNVSGCRSDSTITLRGHGKNHMVCVDSSRK
jgi:hypothetical protein